MRTAAIVGAAVLVVGSLATSSATAASSKASARVANISVMETDKDAPFGEWRTIMLSSLKSANDSDLFVDVALECGVESATSVRSRRGRRSRSTSEAAVEIRVLIDKQEAAPGAVTFCHQAQTVSASFEGFIGGCLGLDELGGLILDEDCIEDEELDVMLHHMSANSYQFIHPDVSQGHHEVEIQARIVTGTSPDDDISHSDARAMIGKGSLTVEEVRMAKGSDLEM